MKEFETPTYFFDYSHSLNCAKVESAKEGQEITVLVRQEENKSLPPITAKGVRTKDGNFVITVTTEAGRQEHSQSYQGLLDSIRANGPNRG